MGSSKSFCVLVIAPGQFFSYPADVSVNGDRAANLDIHALQSWVLAVRVVYRATPTAARDLRVSS